MRRDGRLTLAALTAALAWGVSAGAACASAWIAEGNATGTTALETELGEKLTTEEAKIRLTIPTLPSDSGQATVELVHTTEPKSKTECRTSGAPAGTVVISGEFHVVWSSLSPLEAAALLLFTEMIALCNSEKLKVKVRQPVMMHLNAPTKEVLVSLGLSAKCSKAGKQASPNSYYDDEAKLHEKQLPSANFGLGFEPACIKTEKELTLNAWTTFEVGTAASGLPVIESAPAVELPDVHILSGETYPALAEGKVEGTEVGKLETELGEKLTSNAVTISLEVRELSAAGPMTLTFTGVKYTTKKTSCNTIGDPEGVVKVAAGYHLVYTSTAPLAAGVLIVFSELPVECEKGKRDVTVRSPVIIKLEKATSGVDLMAFGLVAHCIKGKGNQELKEYIYSEGKSVKAILTANVGLGFEPACQEVSKEVVMNTSKMLGFSF
jgi:hypothetical protein